MSHGLVPRLLPWRSLGTRLYVPHKASAVTLRVLVQLQGLKIAVHVREKVRQQLRHTMNNTQNFSLVSLSLPSFQAKCTLCNDYTWQMGLPTQIHTEIKITWGHRARKSCVSYIMMHYNRAISHKCSVSHYHSLASNPAHTPGLHPFCPGSCILLVCMVSVACCACHSNAASWHSIHLLIALVSPSVKYYVLIIAPWAGRRVLQQ